MGVFNPEAQYTQEVGFLTEDMILLTSAPLSPQRILVGQTNLEHMKNEHPDDYKRYVRQLPEIIADPDYIACHPRLGNLQFIKILDDLVLVAVRVTSTGTLFVRSLYVITEETLMDYRNAETVFDWPIR